MRLSIRVPVKAGTRELAATFLKDTVLQEGIVERGDADDVVVTRFEGVATITIAGPYNVQGPGATASREKIFICRPAAGAEDQACVEKILSNLAHHAYRRPVTEGEMSQLLALYRQAAQRGGLESGVRLALEKILVSPAFILRAEYDPPGVTLGNVHRISDLELASRLSFFLWSSIPDDELLAIAENGDSATGPSWKVRSGACWPTHAQRPWCRTSLANICICETSTGYCRIPSTFRTSTRTCVNPSRRRRSFWLKARCARIAASPIC